MLSRQCISKVNGIFASARNMDLGGFQLCCTSQILLARRKSRKSSPFPPTPPNMKLFEDLEKEFGGPPPGRKRDSKFTTGSLPYMPVSHPFIIDTVGSIISEYVPVEKKDWIFTPMGLKQRWEALKMLAMSTYSIAFIKRHTKPFKLRDFAEGAQKSFIEVNMALQENDKARLRELVITSAYHALKKQFLEANQRIYWRHVRTITRPRIVHARVAPIQEKDNLFGQVTVKMHTAQILAITDVHGRKLKGDKKKPKQVIDYVVFERHLTNPYGQWKIIGKIAQPMQIKQSQLQTVAHGAQVARP